SLAGYEEEGGVREEAEEEGGGAIRAEEEGEGAVPAPGGLVYTFFVNFVPEPFPFPIIGLINMARGNHKTVQFGLFNWNTGNFSGLQASFINTVRGDTKGMQAGLINTAIGNTTGLQAGFINTVGGNAEGLRVGLINTSIGDTKGLQAGIINIVIGDTNGLQGGYINTTIGEARGAQIGFINTTIGTTRGLQFGFINTSAKKLTGVQLGFANYADSVEGGVPIGFLSIVRKGGYHVVEYCFSEFYPIGLGLKLGIEAFYTNVFVAYNPMERRVRRHLFFGFGIGSIIPIANHFFANPELSVSFFKGNNAVTNRFLSLVPFFGYKFNKYFSIVVGPSLTRVRANNEAAFQKPFFRLLEHKMGKRNSVFLGARFGVRLHF
ncbi:MAG: hypothetical protein FWC28_02710, partial [Proteobacteria bacterium]|nr:hypothetical protein [Pseudomonadota bacterium]